MQKERKYLRENELIFDSVGYGEDNYYIFDIGSFKGIKLIDFVITPLSGDPNLLISREY